MNRTTTPRLMPVIVVAGLITGGLATGKDSLSIMADAPVVSVTPRDPGRNFLRLPALEYKFRVRTHCSDNRSPESLSLNVADSRLSIGGDEIIRDGTTEMSLRIPAGQIAPLAVENFCVVPDEDKREQEADAPTQVTIPAALSAQASLLCASDEDKTMTYVSRTLDVSLLCRLPAEEAMPVIEPVH